MTVVNIVHIATSLWEPVRDARASPAVLAVIGLCLGLEFIHILGRLTVRWVAGWDHLMGTSRVFVDRMLVILWLIAFVDWVLLLAAPRKYFVLWAFRPILIVFMNNKVRETSHTFYKSLVAPAMQLVMALYLLIVLIAAAMGIALFRHIEFHEIPIGDFSQFSGRL
jgi:hypothetical protein